MIKCTFENGSETSLRHVVVDNLVLNEKREILLVRRTGKILEGGKWALPGGFVERGETIKEAVIREVLEETGYKVGEMILLTIRDNPDRPKEDRQNIAFVYFCKALEKTGEPDKESNAQKWFPFSDLPPKEEIAFDHYDDIMFYIKYKKENLSLPF